MYCRTPRIGDIYLMEFTGICNEQSGLRPGVIIQNNTGNKYSPNVIAIPMTTSYKCLSQSTHVLVKSSDTGLQRDSIALCENPERMSKQRLIKYITSLPDIYMKDIAVAFLLSTSIISYIERDSILEIWDKAVTLNAV